MGPRWICTAVPLSGVCSWGSPCSSSDQSCPCCPWAGAPGWCHPAVSHARWDTVLVIDACIWVVMLKRMSFLPADSLQADVQALLPRARISSQLVSPEPPCLRSTLPSVLLQAHRVCRSGAARSSRAARAPAPASNRHRGQGSVSGKTAQPGLAHGTWLHPRVPAAPSRRSSTSSIPHPAQASPWVALSSCIRGTCACVTDFASSFSIKEARGPCPGATQPPAPARPITSVGTCREWLLPHIIWWDADES